MPDTKITALAAITTVDPAADVLPIVDISDTSMAASGTTKKITSNQILGAGGTATLASATISGDLTVRTNQLIANANGVGVGTAPSAWSGIGPALQVEQASLLSESSNQLYLTANGYFAGGQWNYINNVSADQYYQIAGSHVWRSGTGGAGGTAIGWSTLMTLNSTGLGVGGTAIGTKLEVVTSTSGSIGGTATVTNSAATAIGNAASLNFRTNSNFLSAGYFGARIEAVTPAASNSTDLVFYNYKGVTTSGDETMRITSGGNVGIGVQPSAWASGIKGLQIGSLGGSSIIGYSNACEIGSNFYFDTGYKYGATAASSQIQFTNGEIRFKNAASGTAGQTTTVTSGNSYTITAAGGTNYTTFGAANNNVGTTFTATSSGTGNGGGVTQNITFTQAMTLDSGGNLLVGTTNTSPSVGVGFKANYSATLPAFSIVVNDSAGTGAAYTLYNTNAAAYRFYVANSGTIFATNTTISAISDARLKENVQDIDVGLGAILALKPRKFDWKAGKGKDIKGDRGFIAQEFEQVFPNLIDEWKDEAPEGEAPYKSVRQDLIPVLVKAIQELAARVQTLETR